MSAEDLLELHVGSNVMPKQVIVIVSTGGGVQRLPFDTSVLTYLDPDKIPKEHVEINDLKIMPLPFALCKTSPSYFLRNSENAEIALRSIRSVSETSQIILKYNFKRAGNRIVGTYKHLGMNEQAETIVNDLAGAGVKVIPTNPFETESVFLKEKQF